MAVYMVAETPQLDLGEVLSNSESRPAKKISGATLFVGGMLWWPLYKLDGISPVEHIDVYRSALRGLLKLEEYTVMVTLRADEEKKTLALAQHSECKIFLRGHCVAQFFADLHDTDHKGFESWVTWATREKAETVRSWSYRQWHQFFTGCIEASADHTKQRIDLFRGMQCERSLRALSRS